MYTLYPVIIYKFLGEKERYLFYPPDFNSISVTSDNLQKGIKDVYDMLEAKLYLYSAAKIEYPAPSDFRILCQFKDGPTKVARLVDDLFDYQVTQVTQVGIKISPDTDSSILINTNKNKTSCYDEVLNKILRKINLCLIFIIVNDCIQNNLNTNIDLSLEK